LQLFTHPQHSECFSTLSVTIFEVNIVPEQKQTKRIGEDFFVYFKFAFLSILLLTPAAGSAATCVLSNSTYKLSISTDMIIEALITKLLAKLLTESHWR